MRLHANIARITPSADTLDVFERQLGIGERMQDVLQSLPPGWHARRSGDHVVAWKQRQDATHALPSPWMKAMASASASPDLYANLIKHALVAQGANAGLKILSRKRATLLDLKTNLLTQGEYQIGSAGIHPLYELDVYWMKDAPAGPVKFFLVVASRTQWRINSTIQELAAQGLDVTGCSARLMRAGTPAHLSHLAGKHVGVIERVSNGEVHLKNPVESSITRVPATSTLVEARRHDMKRYLNGLNKNGRGAGAWSHVLSTDLASSAPHATLKRIDTRINTLVGKTIPLTATLTVQVATVSDLTSAGFTTRQLAAPEFIFDYASKHTARTAIKGMREFGPYDKAHQATRHPRVLLVHQAQHRALAQTFASAFDKGYTHPSNSIYNFPGFPRLMRLDGITITPCEFTIHEQSRPGQAYESALIATLESNRAYDLCIVVTEDHHKDLQARDDPYCISKALLFTHGIPVSEVTTSKLAASPDELPHILATMAVQAYAKMGGTPFVIKANSTCPCELILGVGLAEVDTHTGARKKIIGYATVFKSNGDYLIGAAEPVSNPNEPESELTSVIQAALRETITSQGVKDGTQVRLIVHIYKSPGQRHEVKAVRDAISSITTHVIGYAIVHVNDSHCWKLSDRDDSKGIAPRGQIVPLGSNSYLLTTVGPKEYLRRGFPTPLKITIDRSSTFTDTDYLLQTVYDFTCVSWRGFRAASRPVTIQYAHLAAELAGKLEHTTYWQPVLLKTMLRNKKWFL